MAQSRDNVRKCIWIEKGLANPSHIYFKSPNKDRATIPRSSSPPCHCNPKGRKMLMGTKLPHLQEYRRRLGWWSSKTNSAHYSKHSGTRCTATSNARFLVSPDPKLSKHYKAHSIPKQCPQPQNFQHFQSQIFNRKPVCIYWSIQILCWHFSNIA